MSNTKSPAIFSEREIAYLKSQRLARIATVSKELQPDIAPVGSEFDGDHFYKKD
jgi:pyridoxamine 5'-phosphate oxidase family protein